MDTNKIIVHLNQIKQLESNHAQAGSMVFCVVTAVNRSGHRGHGLSKTLQCTFRCRSGRIIVTSSATRLMRRSRKELA
jgi:LDH2 family malate/lactate/ureidoglycolate dehydrogenase